MTKLYIFAKNGNMAQVWRDHQHLTTEQAIYLHGPEILWGASDFVVIKVGPWWEHPQQLNISAVIKGKDGIVVEWPR